MPILGTGTKPTLCFNMRAPLSAKTFSFSRGFTLIELLVVVVIISISIGYVVVNIGGQTEEDLLEEEIVRLQQILRFAHEQSVIRAQEYGVRFYKTGYRFMVFDELNDSWVDVTNDKLLRSRVLPDQIDLDLYIDQTQVILLESPEDDPQAKNELLASAASNIKDTNQPEIAPILPNTFLLSSSELTPPFEVRLRIPGNNAETSLEGLPQGEYKRILEDE